MGWRGALPESRLGRPVAADRVAAWHAFFCCSPSHQAGCIGDRLQVFSKAEDSVLSLLDPVLYTVAPLNFRTAHGTETLFLMSPAGISGISRLMLLAIHTSPPGFILLFPERPCFTTMCGFS